jgi:hypothetical protein
MMKHLLALRLVAVVLAGFMSLGLAAAGHAAEETTIEAFATWQGEGTLVPMGPNPAVLVATLHGVVYIQTDHGPLRSGTIICPAVADVSLDDGKQTAKGRCAWTADDGDQVYAEWTCEGRHLIGCKGDYALTGGTGRFEGVTGGGPVVLRSEIGTIAADASGQAIERTTTGILYWPALKYTLP